MEVSFFDIALRFYFLMLFQNSQSFHNAHKSSNFRGLTTIRKQHIFVVSFFYTHNSLYNS